MAKLLRSELPNEIKRIIDNNFIVTGSPGKGNWTNLPWIGIFNPEITSSAQSGYYIVYLFTEDMKGVYLSLNQGVTDIKNKYGNKKAKEYLFNRSASFRKTIKENNGSNELIKDIKLGTGNFAPFYEAGNIYSKYYSVENLPSEDILVKDLKEFLDLYDVIYKKNDKLVVVEDESEISMAQSIFEDQIKDLANKTITARAGFQGGQEEGTMYWSKDLGIWFQSRKIEDSRYWNGFGLEEPEEGKGYTILCEINFPIKEIRRAVAGVIAKDSNNDYYVLHRGKLGGNFSKKIFEENYKGDWTLVQDGDRETEMVLIGKLNDPNLPYNVRDFVKEINKIKYGDDEIPEEETISITAEGVYSFYNYLIEKGYFFDKETIENYLLSLKVKPFVILTGNSGTGKTKLAQLFAQYASNNILDNNSIKTSVPVKKSATSGGWSLKKRDTSKIINPEDIEGVYNIKVDGIPTQGRLDINTRMYYINKSNDDVKTHLEKLAKDDPEQIIDLEIELDNSQNPQYKIVPVGANWTENRHIVGFYNVITEKYQSTPALDLILDSKKSNLPHFLILDEMNLSHVERYFADFLSALESGESIPLYLEKDGSEIPSDLKLPKNLLVIGTVNVDETTYMFSPKVLDRANTLEFATYSAQDYMNNDFSLETPSGDILYLENPLEDLEIRSADINDLRNVFENVYSSEGDNIWDVLSEELESFQNVLKKAGFDFGFRVINEILRFMYVAWKYEKQPPEWNNRERYFDAQIKQKMLPKLHGSERVLGETITELSKLCLDSSDNIRFPTSYQKLKEMEKVLYEQRYVSFIN